MPGIEPPLGCCKIDVLNPPPPQSFIVEILPNGIGYPVGGLTKHEGPPELGVYYRDDVDGAIWVFDADGSWHDFGPPARWGTWGPC